MHGELSCLRCEGAVFHAEALYAKGKPFHQSCSTCVICNKRLDSLSLNNGPDGEIYCKGCHETHFGSHKGQAGSYHDVKVMKLVILNLPNHSVHLTATIYSLLIMLEKCGHSDLNSFYLE